MSDRPIPYGFDELDPHIIYDSSGAKRIRCFVRGCSHFLRPPANSGFRGDVCAEHGIRCHSSGTYTYADATRNVIIDQDVFAERVIGNPDKYESSRLGSEKSEDTLTWNVFRTFQKLGCLSQLMNELFGIQESGEPTLYLWGLRASDESFAPWDLLRQARIRFEANLPVNRPLTEPDITLHVPGKYLILIEAKFTSPNSFYEQGPRKDERSLTLDELRQIYQDPSLRFLDTDKARTTNRIHYQFWRNIVFAEWMASQDSPSTQAFHVSLVRSRSEKQSAVEFKELMKDPFKDRFQRVTWEEIHAVAKRKDEKFERLCRYLKTKSANLVKSFDL